MVTGKGSDVLENLENITFNDKPLQVKYFDKFANPVAKPNYETALPEGVNVNTVLNKYIETIGGKEKLESVASLAMMAEGEMQGMKLNLELKKTSKDQFMQDIKVMGNSMTKQVLNGNQGYIIMQGQRKEMSAEEIKKVKEESMLFPELRYLDSDVSLESIEDIDGKRLIKSKFRKKNTFSTKWRPVCWPK